MMKNTLDIFACFINTLSHILIILIHAVKPVLCTLDIVKGMRKKIFALKGLFSEI